MCLVAAALDSTDRGNDRGMATMESKKRSPVSVTSYISGTLSYFFVLVNIILLSV